MDRQTATIENNWTVANGWRLHSRAALQAAPPGAPDAVLVHGLVVSSGYMEPLLQRLAPDYRVFAPDLPGFGDSDKPGRTLSIPELADSLAYWMDSVGLKKPMLIGNSFGCQIAVDFASRYPERVRCLVLVGPTVDPKARNVLLQVFRWIRNSFIEPPSLGPELLRDYVKAGFVRSVKTLWILVSDIVEDKLPKVAVPTLVVRGALDPIVPDRWALEMTRLLPDSHLSVIPGVAHTANYAAPLEVARMARIFDRHPRYVPDANGG